MRVRTQCEHSSIVQAFGLHCAGQHKQLLIDSLYSYRDEPDKQHGCCRLRTQILAKGAPMKARLGKGRDMSV